MNDLGAEQFTGKDKKAYEARKIVERGGRVRNRFSLFVVMLFLFLTLVLVIFC